MIEQSIGISLKEWAKLQVAAKMMNDAGIVIDSFDRGVEGTAACIFKLGCLVKNSREMVAKIDEVEEP